LGIEVRIARLMRGLPRILLNAANVVSLPTFVLFVGWWNWGPPPAWRPTGVFIINAKERRYLDEHPSEGPLEGYYSLPMGSGVEFTFGEVVCLAAGSGFSACGLVVAGDVGTGRTPARVAAWPLPRVRV
jgi:hypothetical protein